MLCVNKIVMKEKHFSHYPELGFTGPWNNYLIHAFSSHLKLLETHDNVVLLRLLPQTTSPLTFIKRASTKLEFNTKDEAPIVSKFFMACLSYTKYLSSVTVELASQLKFANPGLMKIFCVIILPFSTSIFLSSVNLNQLILMLGLIANSNKCNLEVLQKDEYRRILEFHNKVLNFSVKNYLILEKVNYM